LLVIYLFNGFFHFRQLMKEIFQVIDVKVFNIIRGFFAHDDVKNIQDLLVFLDLLINISYSYSLHGVFIPAHCVLVTNRVVEAAPTVLVMLKLSNLRVHL
jgi:hypothetical protein